jgi:hypothetical protein
MTDKTEQRDLRDSHRTDESRAAEKKAGDSPFDGEEKHPQDPSNGVPASAIKE